MLLRARAFITLSSTQIAIKSYPAAIPVFTCPHSNHASFSLMPQNSLTLFRSLMHNGHQRRCPHICKHALYHTIQVCYVREITFRLRCSRIMLSGWRDAKQGRVTPKPPAWQSCDPRPALLLSAPPQILFLYLLPSGSFAHD